MGKLLKNMAGMGDLTEQVIASDLLNSAKDGIKNYAVALTETASPQVRCVLKRHLNDAVDAHEQISNYMIIKGYYQAYNPKEQIKADINTVDQAMNL